jgi:hypothetical protein
MSILSKYLLTSCLVFDVFSWVMWLCRTSLWQRRRSEAANKGISYRRSEATTN